MHAAWGGAWEWRRVARALQARGHEVFTPTLTGLGERAHLAGPDVGLDTHVRDVVSMLVCEDLRDTVLVGHSSAGMVVSGVMDAVPHRIGHAVFLDALVAEDGEALVDLIPPEIAERMIRGPATRSGSGWAVPQPFRAAELTMSAEDAAWYVSRTVPHPLRCFEQPLELTGRWVEVPAVTFVHCTVRSEYLPADPGGGDGSFIAASGRRARARGWSYRELATGHDPHVTDPELLCELLDDVAADVGS